MTVWSRMLNFLTAVKPSSTFASSASGSTASEAPAQGRRHARSGVAQWKRVNHARGHSFVERFLDALQVLGREPDGRTGRPTVGEHAYRVAQLS